jgi:hypothetical protein
MIQEWVFCTSYAKDALVLYGGHLYRAIQQSAGQQPDQSPAYWADLGEFSPVTAYHNDLLGIDGNGTFHLSEEAAEAAENAFEPGADNPFLTERQAPALALSMGPFEPVVGPLDFGVIYGGHYDEDTHTLCIVGDNKVAWYEEDNGTLITQVIGGAWRGVVKHGNVWVVVGVNCVASGSVNHLTLGNIPAGAYNAIASSGGRVVAVGDGAAARSDSGTGGWQGVKTAKGYGDGIAYNEADGLFYAVGYSGAQTSPDGQVWTPDSGMPAGTWRGIVRSDGCMVAAAGRLAHKIDGEDWDADDTQIGGWDDVASGSGYHVAVTNGRCVVSRARAFEYAPKEIPDYVYTSVVYGGGRFWALGSAIVAARVTSVADGLLNANSPNESNPFATMADVRSARDDLSAEIAWAVEEARVFWGGGVI